MDDDSKVYATCFNLTALAGADSTVFSLSTIACAATTSPAVVYYVDPAGHIHRLSTDANGTWGHEDLSAKVATGSPVYGLSCSADGTRVFYLVFSGDAGLRTVMMLEWNGAQWNVVPIGANAGAQGSAFGTPRVALANRGAVYYGRDDGHVCQLYEEASGWQFTDLTLNAEYRGVADSDPIPSVSGSAVYFVSSQAVQQLWWDGHRWCHTDLNQAAFESVMRAHDPPPAVAPLTQIAVADYGVPGDASVYYVAPDGGMHSLHWSPDPVAPAYTHWMPGHPSRGHPHNVARGARPLAYRLPGQGQDEYVAYIGVHGNVNRLYWNGHDWSWENLSQASGCPGVAQSALNAFVTGAREANVVYRRSPDQTIEVLFERGHAKNIAPQDIVGAMLDYAPLVYLDENEQYFPSSVDFAFPHLKRTLRDGKYSLETKEKIDPDRLLPYFAGDLPGAKVYAFFVQKYGPYTDITYLFFYPYDLGFGAVQNHVGDWEHATVRLRWRRSGDSWIDPVPVRVLLSAHTFANQALWDAIEKEGTHPVIYSARGTHAGWFSAGWQRHDGVVWDHCSKGQRWETWKADVASLFSWNPANPLPTTEDSEFTATSLHGADVPRWMRSNRYADRGQGDGSDPRDGAIYRWGNPATSWLDNVWLVDGPEGPLEKWEIWLPWTLG